MNKKALSMQDERQEMLLAEAFTIFRRVKVNNNLSKATIRHYEEIDS